MYYRIPQTGDPGDLGGGKASLHEMKARMEPTTQKQQHTGSGPKLQNLPALVWDLAKNDFRVRFAGSYFGIIWAFAQPLVTVLLFWFVFQVGLRAAPAAQGAPYGLWLAVGLAPWFYFSEGWTTSTSALGEYAYIVKKIVFRVELLPLVKIVSAFFFHLAFLTVLIILTLATGRLPTWHLLQLPYYCLCTGTLILALGYTTAAVYPFFRDLIQLLNIAIQFGMWLTPIMWSVAMVPAKFQWIFKLNPVGYIVEGYRDSFFGGAWIWDHWLTTLGFWTFSGVAGGLAFLVFRRLRPHFADVL